MAVSTHGHVTFLCWVSNTHDKQAALYLSLKDQSACIGAALPLSIMTATLEPASTGNDFRSRKQFTTNGGGAEGGAGTQEDLRSGKFLLMNTEHEQAMCGLL